ncbi:DUF4403 family protein [Flavobacterium suncheonense]|uniref:Lipoprotein n=1 Tax=Flavobacterium suncheonense GH29-5 = DSM 17707 TaxID=1121899 RepID=A0A0A2MAZ6_9FLAO|nr:DUF4403 family protein [Flavobacterium suncheonense]KGO89842.1 hypothetical protein Q764_06550 [Flavobacterium suncheonense GH29-5 = DSM 17707]
MKTILSLLTASALLTIFTGCSTSKRVDALKPTPSDNTPTVYKTTTSFIAMPVEVPLKEIENQLNKTLTGLIYNDSILSDDNTEMKIWKQAPVKLAEKDGKIQSVLPMKIWIRVKYGTEFLGMNDMKDINLNGTIKLLSEARLSNWKLTTTSVIEDFEWSESPSIEVKGRNIPITYLVNPTLRIFKTKIAKKIDEAINKSTDFKPQVLNVLEKLSTPFLTSEQYETWFKLIPTELYVTDAVLSKSKITMDMGLKCSMQTIVGQQPLNTFKKENIQLKPVTKMPNKIEATVAAVSTYESASRILTKNFQGQTFASGSRKITVQKVDVWHKDGKMIIALDMIGSVNGTIYLSGFPNYNAVTKEIYFDQLDYVLNTKGVLTKTANWLLSGMILRKIQESCRYSIKGNLEDGKKNMQPYLNNYSPMKGVFVNGSLNDFEFDKVELTDKAIIAFIKTSGQMNIKIDGME